MQRYFIDTLDEQSKTAIIKGSDVHHISHVMRYKIGDMCVVCSQGICYEARINSITSDTVTLSLINQEPTKQREYTIDLFQALIRKEKFEYVLQKSTELGIHSIYPLDTTRSIVKIKPQKEESKLERWNKIVKEASEQSHRQTKSIVKNVVSMDELNPIIKSYDVVLLAHTLEDKTVPLQTVLESKYHSIALIIGPEGGFTPREVDELVSLNNVKAVSLGSRILRSETASSYLLSVLDYEHNRGDVS